MRWPPADPKLAREASSILADLDRTIQAPNLSPRTAANAFDMVGRLLSIGLGVVSEDKMVFNRQVSELIDKLPPSSAAYRLLDQAFRQANAPLLTLHNLANSCYWRARWHCLGCPAVTLESNLAASLMATEMSDEFLTTIKPPWDCFAVRLPRDIVELGQLEFAHIIVHRYHRNLDMLKVPDDIPDHLRDMAQRAGEFFHTKSGCLWALFGVSDQDKPLQRADLLSVLLGKEKLEYLFDDAPQDETSEDRLVHALARLVVGICCMAENPNALRRKSTKKQQHHRWRFSKLPLTTEYVLAPDVPVKFDCTEAVGAYLRGDRKGPPRIQYVVRGHWRNQAHGPGRMARKRIWIQPYWKGPEDASRLFREYRFGRKPEGTG